MPILSPPRRAVLAAGAAYFAFSFLAGFALGALRVAVVAPRLGAALAVALEAPLILTASWFAARWCVKRFGVPAAPGARLAMGGVAFALLMLAELGAAVFIFHRSLAQHLAGYLSAAGGLGLAAQLAFAGIPWALAWASPRRGLSPAAAAAHAPAPPAADYPPPGRS